MAHSDRFSFTAGVHRSEKTPSEWELCVSSPLWPRLHPYWRSPRILSTPLRLIHSFFHTYLTCGVCGRKGKQRNAHIVQMWTRGHVCGGNAADRMTGQLSFTTQRPKQTTIDYKTVCCSWAARWRTVSGTNVDLLHFYLRSNKILVIFIWNESYEFIVTFWWSHFNLWLCMRTRRL